MALPFCRRCGEQDPQRMYGLMTLWFGPLVELEADLGYFYLCPACHDECVAPELERIQNRILELHPAAARSLDESELSPAEAYSEEQDEADGASAPDPDAPTDPAPTDAGPDHPEEEQAGG